MEKNMCDNLIGTLFNINGKTKDDLNSHLDLIDINIRGKLPPIQVGKQTYLPTTCYTMLKEEKVSFCQCLKGVKVSMQDLKLIGLKSHDSHILMQQLLPITVCGIYRKMLDTP